MLVCDGCGKPATLRGYKIHASDAVIAEGDFCDNCKNDLVGFLKGSAEDWMRGDFEDVTTTSDRPSVSVPKKEKVYPKRRPPQPQAPDTSEVGTRTGEGTTLSGVRGPSPLVSQADKVEPPLTSAVSGPQGPPLGEAQGFEPADKPDEPPKGPPPVPGNPTPPGMREEDHDQATTREAKWAAEQAAKGKATKPK